jgi:transaldolase
MTQKGDPTMANPDTTAKTTKMQALLAQGQSVWLDYLQRGMTRSGELRRLIDRGLRGQTSNPTIFEHAIGTSADYDEDFAALSAKGLSDAALFEAVAVADVQEAADQFRSVYDSTDGGDGFVSLEVSPLLARDTQGSIDEALRLWRAVDRPNVMIKIPGTREGWPAIERGLTEGLNINITLLFSLEHYRQVAEAYLRALEARVERGQPIHRIASVASFFVSRVDTEVDKRLASRAGAPSDLHGKAAIAGARLAYAMFEAQQKSARWQALAAKGAQPQRLLWASTGTKNPKFSDVLYVDSLIGPQTITTVPPETLDKFEDHGRVAPTLAGSADGAQRVTDAIAAAGIDFEDVYRTLEDEAIVKFETSYKNLLEVVGRKRTALAR